MKTELIELAERVCANRNWTESYLSRAFGYGTIMENLRDGRRMWPETEERFESWLKSKLDDASELNSEAAQ